MRFNSLLCGHPHWGALYVNKGLYKMNIEESATKLSRNPLGIIALFILLIYGFATLLFGFVGNTFTEAQKWWFVIFLVIFPVLVLFVFAYLVINHHQKLYAPSDYRDEKNFFGYSSPKEQEEKIEKEAKELLENSEPDDNKASSKKQIIQSFAERRDRMEHIENLVFDYYEKKYDYDFDRNVYFNINERKICFDGLSERKGVLNFFEIKYTPNLYFPIPLLSNVILNAINIQNYMLKTGKYPNYKYRLKLIFVVESDELTEKREFSRRIKNMIDTESINISVSVFSVKQLENNLK